MSAFLNAPVPLWLVLCLLFVAFAAGALVAWRISVSMLREVVEGAFQ